MQCLLSLSGAKILKSDEGNQNWQQQKVFFIITKNKILYQFQLPSWKSRIGRKKMKQNHFIINVTISDDKVWLEK